MKRVIISIATAFMLTFGALAVPVGAQGILGDACNGVSSTLCDRSDDEAETFIKQLVNVLLWVVGILAVVMIIISGIKYVTSGGDSAKLTSAKNTLLYSVIGLLIAIFAFAIVNWVVDWTPGS